MQYSALPTSGRAGIQAAHFPIDGGPKEFKDKGNAFGTMLARAKAASLIVPNDDDVQRWAE